MKTLIANHEERVKQSQYTMLQEAYERGQDDLTVELIQMLESYIEERTEPSDEQAEIVTNIIRNITRASHEKHKWTPELSQLLMKRTDEGWSPAKLAISSEIGFTEAAIRKQLWKLGYRSSRGVYTRGL